MIDTRKLKELVRLMVENELTELDLRDKDETVTIKRGGEGPVAYHAAAPMLNGSAGPAHAQGSASGASDDAGADDPDLVAIESPMVGTFYSAPNPDADPYVSVGSNVSNGSVVCVVEAMKVFNEIKSDASGVVERILVQNGDAVEFGQKLFLVRPA
ncbi:MAG: acetyl-CoA carboxylase biotin carboxyl carrier protein [Phycisphaerales bacterium]